MTLGLVTAIAVVMFIAFKLIRKGLVDDLKEYIRKFIEEELLRNASRQVPVKALIAKLEAELAHERARLSELVKYGERLEAFLAEYGGGKPPEASAIQFYEILGGQWQRITDMASIKATESKVYGVRPKDAKGNDSVLDGPGVWALTDPAMGTFEPAADGLTAKLTPAGPVASLAIEFTGDKRLGEEVVPIKGTLPLEIIAGETETIELFEVV